MKLPKGSYLASLVPPSEERLIPYIRKFLVVHPYAGVYTVNDEKYENKCSSPETMHFHPSSDCMKCPRLLYFERTVGYAERLDSAVTPELQVIFKMGSAIHAMLQAWFLAWNDMDGMPHCVGNEVRIEDDELNIGGYIDSVLKFPESDDEIPIEIKTINSYQFGLLKQPKPEHRMQVGLYIAETGAPYGIVLYCNKDSGEMKEFRVEPVDLMPVLMKWGKVRQAVKDRDISILECGCNMSDDTTFKRCPARAFCPSV